MLIIHSLSYCYILALCMTFFDKTKQNDIAWCLRNELYLAGRVWRWCQVLPIPLLPVSLQPLLLLVSGLITSLLINFYPNPLSLSYPPFFSSTAVTKAALHPTLITHPSNPQRDGYPDLTKVLFRKNIYL